MTTSYTPSLSGWNPAPPNRRAAVAVLLLHVAGIALLAGAGHKVAKQMTPKPVEIAVVQEPPPASPTPAALPSPRVNLPMPQLLQLPMPEVVALSAPREVAATTEPTPAPPTPTQVAPVTRSAAVAPPAPTPKTVAATSLRWRVEPAVEVPRLSRRAGEAGRVVLRVVFDTEGRPRDIQLARSSGFARLDAQAHEAMQAAHIVPYVEEGRPIEVMALATLEYELN